MGLARCLNIEAETTLNELTRLNGKTQWVDVERAVGRCDCSALTKSHGWVHVRYRGPGPPTHHQMLFPSLT